ncbi:tyrosine-type recombinase/integrase [Cohnella massiliensis]|uniref:tyrosine-type recombinase/integrase n=1 Tax=Cohnella massiliensis TaxID=1816691 RepID=UPI0009B9AAB1|nr:tyrosine-type recombinase/integrase [Cohnella massiliensis]
MKIHEAVAHYLEHLVAEGKSENTVKGYAMCFKRFMIWLDSSWGNVSDIEDVSQTVVRDFKSFLESRTDRRTGKQLAPNTINQNLIALKSLFVFVKGKGVNFRSDPISAIKLKPIASQNDYRWLTRHEVNQILHAIEMLERTGEKRKAMYKAVVAVLVNCGLRVEELSGLRLTDVVMDSGLIVVRSGKGGKYRHVPFNVKTRDILQKWLAHHGGNSPFLFYSQRSQQLSVRAIQHMIEKLSDLTQIKFTVHQLRHTYGKQVANERGIEAAATLLGHSNIQTTRRYIQPSLQELRDAVEGIEFE